MREQYQTLYSLQGFFLFFFYALDKKEPPAPFDAGG